MARCAVAAGLLWAAAGALPAAPPAGPAPAAEDPVPIRRILLRPDQLPAELERARRGILLPMPRARFEDRVRQAATAARDADGAPRLVESRYRASLSGEALQGTAEWQLVHDGPTPALFAAEPFWLAVRKPRWRDGTPALFADFKVRPDAAGPELLVGRSGGGALTFEWSARGLVQPGGTRFDLRVPACPVATLRLDLPADQEPLFPREGCLLTGPLPGSGSDRRSWQVVCGGVTHLDVVIRPVPGAGPAPLVFVRQQNRQEVAPGIVSCEFGLELEVPADGARELVLDCDPALRPTEVVARNLAGWEVLRGQPAEAPARVAISFREPITSGTVTLRGVAPVPTDAPWVSPWVRVVGSVPRGELLTVRVHPDLTPNDWRRGTFRLVDAGVGPDRWQSIGLSSGWGEAERERPSARFRHAGPEYQITQRLWWDVAPRRMELTAHCEFDVGRGPIFQVPFRLPPGWEVDRVEGTPVDAVAGWSVAAAAPRAGPPVLTVELHKPLTAGSVTKLLVILVRRGPPPAELALPDLWPTAARGRDGTIAVRVSPQLQPEWVDASSAAMAAPPPEVDGRVPWTPETSDRVLELRSTESRGQLRLQTRPMGYAATGASTVSVTGRRMHLVHRLTVEPAAGGTDAVLVQVSARPDQPWAWRALHGAAHIRSVERLNLPTGLSPVGLAAGAPWLALTPPLAANLTAPALWRITFARLVQEPVELEATADFDVPDLERRNDAAPVLAASIPLVTTPLAERSTLKVTVDLTAAPRLRVLAGGLQEVAAIDTTAWRHTFTVGPRPGTLALAAADGSAAGPVSPATAVVGTVVAEEGPLQHHCTLRLFRWRSPQLALWLPPGAVVRRVSVNGSEVSPALATVPADQSALEVPCPRGEETLTVEVRYETPQPTWRVWTRLVAEAPRLPVPVETRCVWWIPDHVEPLDDSMWWNVPAGPIPDSNPQGTGGVWKEPRDRTNHIVLVRTAAVTSAGVTISAAVAALAVLAFRRAVRWWAWLAFGVVGASGLAAIWLPAALRPAAVWPMLTTAALGVATLRHGFASLTLAASAARPSSVRQLGGATFGLAVWLTAVGQAGAPAPDVVYLVPGAGEDEAPIALVPPELMDRLDAIIRGASADLTGARIVSAHYEGDVGEATARFTASLQIHCLSDVAQLSLPLSGVLLREAVLDGVPALPRAEADRCVVAVRGRGDHALRLDFQVPVAQAGDEREVRFPVPEVAESRLVLRLPAGASYVHAVNRRGGQNVERQGGATRLEADLGRVVAVHARWHVPAGSGTPATVRAQEAYLWDLAESGGRLLGAVRFSISGGSVPALGVDLPRDLQVVTVSARPIDPAAPGGASNALRRWGVSPGERGNRLILEFAAPVSGGWHVGLELVPAEPLPANAMLSFPTAEAVPEGPSGYAWRAQGVEASAARVQGLAPLSEDTFLRDLWLPTRIESDPRLPTRAYRRSGQTAPAVRLTLTPPASTAGAVEEWNWRVGPSRAELQVMNRTAVRQGTLSVLEWEVPPAVQVTEVRGTDVHTWARSGSRLQVWLQRPVLDTAVQWSGVMVRPADAPARFDLPAVRPADVPFSAAVQVAPMDGFALTPALTQQLRPAPSGRQGVPEWSYQIDTANYRAAFTVRPAFGTMEIRVVTDVQRANDRLTAATAIDCEVAQGELRSLRFAVERAGRSDIRVDAPNARTRELTSDPARRIWQVDLPPGVTGRYRISVTTLSPPDVGPAWEVPNVRLVPAGRLPAKSGRQVRLIDESLDVADAVGLRPSAGGRSWEIAEDGWALRVRPALRGGGPRMEVLFGDVAATRGHGGAARRATLWLAHPGGAELHCEWPAPVLLLRAGVDDGSVTPPNGPIVAHSMRLPDVGSVRAVTLEWQEGRGAWPPSSSGLPRLSSAGIPIPTGPLLWAVTVPAGHSALEPAPIRPAEAALRRAEGYLRVALRLGESAGPGPEAERVRRLRAIASSRTYLRQADAMRARDQQGDTEDSMRLRKWSDWLRAALRELPAAPEGAAEDGTHPPTSDGLTTPVEVFTWYFAAGQTAPSISWSQPAAAWPVQLGRSTAFGLLFGVVVWWVRRRGSDAWPEALAVAGLGMWLVAALPWTGLVVFAAGLAGRVPTVAGALAGRLRPPQPPTSPAAT